MSTDMRMDTTSRAGLREWVGLAVLALPTLLVSIDVFVMLLALPHLARDLGASSTEQLWITDGYGFLLAGFLITMGTLGDRIGRRKLLLVGAAAFGVTSVVAAYSTSPEMMVVARALLGIAGATIAPSGLALITTMFRDERQRAVAIGTWFVCFMAGAVVGPVVGGLLLDRFWWGAAFLLGVPAMLLLLVLGPVLLPEQRAERPGRLDLYSVALSLAAILPTVWGLKELAVVGVTPAALAAIVVGPAFAIGFVRRQRRMPDPLLDLRLFGDRAFGTALGCMFMGTLSMGAMMLFTTQQIQVVAGLSPFEAGLWMLPAAAASLVSFQASPVLARWVRPATLIGGGLALSVTGLALLTLVDADSGPMPVALCFALINLGAGPQVTIGTHLVVSAAPSERAGAAAALNETSGQLGFALGIAALGSLGAVAYRGSLSPDVTGALPVEAAAAAREGLAGATAAAEVVPGALGEQLVATAREAATVALHVTAGVSALAMLVVALVAVRMFRHITPLGAAQPVAD
jgi:DHA2 family multidrug resistance protein-like MFS transporter